MIENDPIIYPWSYNPSNWTQRIRVALVALPAFIIAVLFRII